MTEWVQRWWRGEAGATGALVSAATLPAELAFRAVIAVRGAAYDHDALHAQRVAAPVVSIGNISVGGAGKTPFAAFIARRLAEAGHSPALLHGGYAQDEPDLHRQWNPDIAVFVGRDRVASAQHAVEQGATVLVLDDGFQHRRLARDVDLVLVAAETWTSTPRLLPRGPWREPVGALRRASAIVVTERTDISAQTRARIRREIEHAAPGVPVCVAALRAAGWRRATEPAAVAAQTPTGSALAVAGIAFPELFVRAAQQAGAHVDEVLTYRDHHAYTTEDAREITMRAAGRPIVTTTKDWIKLGALLDGTHVWLLEQEVVIAEDEAALDGLLAGLRAH